MIINLYKLYSEAVEVEFGRVLETELKFWIRHNISLLDTGT